MVYYERIPANTRPKYIDEAIKKREANGYRVFSENGTEYYAPNGEKDSEFWTVNMIKNKLIEFHSFHYIAGFDAVGLNGWTHHIKTTEESELREALAALTERKETVA